MKLDQACSSVLGPIQRCKLQSVRAEKMWVAFHKFSLQEGLKLCKVYDKRIDLKACDIFWQLIMEKKWFSKFIDGSAIAHATNNTTNRVLSSIEENAIHYTAGYVVKKLITKYSRAASTTSSAYLTVLKDMGGKLSKENTSRESGASCQWTKTVDRGGLFHVNTIVYDLFLYLEMTVDEKLTSIFKSKGKGIEKVRKEKMNWLCENDEVQLVWSMICTLDDDDAAQDLLKEIASMWITIRGHSKARRIKEDYKRAKATSTKGKRSLRKELKRHDTESTSGGTE